MKKLFTLLCGGIHRTALLVCLCGFVPFAGAQDIYLNNLKASRILFFGNSITICPPAPSIGWNNDWGMAASRPENDYVHILTKDIVQAAGGTPTIMATYNAQFEWNYNTTYDWSSLQPQLDFTPDIVIVAIGENLAPLGTEQSKNEFAVAFARLLAQFKSNGNPAIVVRSSFIADPTFGVMRHVADTAGAVYVEQTWIGNDAHNHAYSEPYYAHNNAFNGHPGNQGMAVIAKSLYSSIVAYSLAVPETDHCCVSACRRRLPAFRWRRRNAVGRAPCTTARNLENLGHVTGFGQFARNG